MLSECIPIVLGRLSRRKQRAIVVMCYYRLSSSVGLCLCINISGRIARFGLENMSWQSSVQNGGCESEGVRVSKVGEGGVPIILTTYVWHSYIPN